MISPVEKIRGPSTVPARCRSAAANTMLASDEGLWIVVTPIARSWSKAQFCCGIKSPVP